MLGTNDAHWGFQADDYKGAIRRLVAAFPRVPHKNVYLIAPPPLWREGIFGGMRQQIINHELPNLLAELATELSAHLVNICQLMLDAQVRAGAQEPALVFSCTYGT